MLRQLLTWLENRLGHRDPIADTDLRDRLPAVQSAQLSPGPTLSPPLSTTPAPRPADAAPRAVPESADDADGPAQVIPLGDRIIREDTGTHETLKILDESTLGTYEDQGIDPYNSGRFDRSRTWDRRNGK